MILTWELLGRGLALAFVALCIVTVIQLLGYIAIVLLRDLHDWWLLRTPKTRKPGRWL